MPSFILKAILMLFISSLLSCSKKSTVATGRIKARPTAKEGFNIPEKYTKPLKKKGGKKDIVLPSSRSAGTEGVGKKRKKTKMKYANHTNEHVEKRKKELALENEEFSKNSKYTDPAQFGEDESIYKRNGKVKKKFAHPPYVMNPKYNLSDKEKARRDKKSKERMKKKSKKKDR